MGLVGVVLRSLDSCPIDLFLEFLNTSLHASLLPYSWRLGLLQIEGFMAFLNQRQIPRQH